MDPENGLRTIRPHVHHLPRGLRWRWHGAVWMALGGAHSVDKPLRSEGRSWWPEELLTDADVDRAIGGGTVDVIVAHDAPDRVLIPGLTAANNFAAEQLATAAWHRGRIGVGVDATEPALLFHGHYHRRYDAQRYGKTVTRILGLGDDNCSLRDNVLILNLRDLPAGDES